MHEDKVCSGVNLNKNQVYRCAYFDERHVNSHLHCVKIFFIVVRLARK